MPGVGEHELAGARIEPNHERGRKRDIVGAICLVKGVTQLVHKLPLFALVDVSSHEAEQAPGRDSDCLAVTAHVGEGDSVENTVLTDGQIVDVTSILAK